MKFLFIGDKQGYHLDDVAEDWEIAETLKLLGHSVFFVKEEEGMTLSSGGPYDFVFLAKTRHISAAGLQELKFNTSAKIVYWMADHCMGDEMEPNWQEFAKLVDVWLGRDKVNPWFGLVGINYYYWNFDVACNLFQKDESRASLNHNPQSRFPDVVPINFIGNWVHSPYRTDLLREIQAAFPDDLHITTLHMQEMEERCGLKNLHDPLYGEKFNQLVGGTLINLSIDHTNSEGYWSPRTARIMAAGGFALVKYVKGMESVFGDYVEYFRTSEEAVEKIKYFLFRSDLREAMAERGYKFANEQLRPVKRVKELLIYLEQTYG